MAIRWKSSRHLMPIRTRRGSVTSRPAARASPDSPVLARYPAGRSKFSGRENANSGVAGTGHRPFGNSRCGVGSGCPGNRASGPSASFSPMSGWAESGRCRCPTSGRTRRSSAKRSERIGSAADPRYPGHGHSASVLLPADSEIRSSACCARIRGCASIPTLAMR